MKKTLLALALLAAPAVLADLPKAAKKDAKLEAEMAKLLEAEWPGEKALKVVIVAKDWTVETVRLKDADVPQRRFIDTKVAVKQASGCRVFEVRYEQPAKSMKAFGPTQFGSVGGSEQIDCEAVK